MQGNRRKANTQSENAAATISCSWRRPDLGCVLHGLGLPVALRRRPRCETKLDSGFCASAFAGAGCLWSVMSSWLHLDGFRGGWRVPGGAFAIVSCGLGPDGNRVRGRPCCPDLHFPAGAGLFYGHFIRWLFADSYRPAVVSRVAVSDWARAQDRDRWRWASGAGDGADH